MRRAGYIRTSRWAVWSFCLLTVGLLFTIHLLTGRYADDFYYSTFWRSGWDGFLALNADHFATFNGRILVHLVAQSVLALPELVFPFLNTGLLVLMAVLACRFQSPEGTITPTAAALGVGLFAAQLLGMNVQVLRESLLWVSASYNYMLPVLLALAALLFQRGYLDGRFSHWVLPLYLLFQFLCGATTEQCGAMMVVLSLCYGLCRLLRRDAKRPWAFFFAPVCNLLGYLTIFLSPATQNRMATVGESVFSAMLGEIPALATCLLGPGRILPLCVLFCLVSALFSLLSRSVSRLLRLGLPVGCFLLWAAAAGTQNGFTAALWVFILYTLLAAGLLLFASPYRGSAVLLLGGLTSAATLLPANTMGARLVLPLALTLCLVSAYLTLELLRLRWAVSARCSAGLAAGLAALLLVCTAVFLPTLRGYWANHQLDRVNLASVARAKESGVLRYNMDYDPNCGFSRMYSSDYCYRNFRAAYGLEDCKIYLLSDYHAPVIVGHERLPSPAYRRYGLTCFAPAEVIPALGGTVKVTPIGTYYQLGDFSARLSQDGILYYWLGGPKELPMEGKEMRDFYTPAFSADVFRQVFGVFFQYDPQRRCYIASWDAPNLGTFGQEPPPS